MPRPIDTNGTGKETCPLRGRVAFLTRESHFWQNLTHLGKRGFQPQPPSQSGFPAPNCFPFSLKVTFSAKSPNLTSVADRFPSPNFLLSYALDVGPAYHLRELSYRFFRHCTAFQILQRRLRFVLNVIYLIA